MNERTILATYVCFLHFGEMYGHLHTSAVSYMEPVYYDIHALQHQHRTRRSTSETIKLKFEAFSREWKLTLRQDNTIYSPELIIENSKGPVNFDMTSAYVGAIEGESSHVFGTVTSSGHFEGQINIHNSSYIMEKAVKHKIEAHDLHTVMYNMNDVTLADHSSFCNRNKLPIPEKTDADGQYMQHVGDDDFKDFQLRYTSTKESFHKRFRRAIDPNKKICELYVQVDHTLFFKFNNVTDDVIGSINNHVMAVNSIYNAVDFDGDASPDNIGFSIKRIKIHEDPTVPGYKYPGNYGVNSMLYLHSGENYDDFCLSYIFTYRDFDNGILGLAWTAESGSSGGLCSKYTLYTDGKLSLNSGIVTFLNYGNDVTTAVSYSTFAHEIGHNFGSWHDETSNAACAPGGTEGNYIMFAQATTGTKPNNVKFSTCSISQMAPMVASRGRDSSDGCFVPYSGSTCGNKVVETGEDCDCGWDEECTDTCCYPSLAGGGTNAEKACQLKSNANCSPTQGVCCNPTTCSPYVSGDNQVCRMNSSCLDKAVCSGALGCPISTSSANGTICGDEKVCYIGQCSSQVCQAHGHEQCQCTPSSTDNWKDPLLCTLCCVDPADSTCKPAEQISGMSLPFKNAVPGTPCNNFLGYCDVFHICREVDPSGPLSTLKNFLLHGELINKVKDFLIEHWYVAIAGGVGLIIILVLIVKVCSKSSKSKVGPAPRRISVESSSRPVHTRF